MGDRSGGREAKGSQLKKSKKNPGSVAARGKKRVLELPTTGPTSSLPPPRPTTIGLHIDCGAALLSRQFDRDRDRVLQRAQTEGKTEAVVLWFSDVEKQQQLADICKDNFGFCYNVVGVHPDNIQNTNKRSHDTWLIKIEDIARRPECLGILSGFNLQKELATHFAQETLLKASCVLADRLLLPLVLHVAGDGASLDKAIELLRSEGWTADNENDDIALTGRRVILHDAITACGGDASKIDAAVEAGFYCSISAAGLTEADEAIQTKARTAVSRIPTALMLVCSDSPWRTPQNLPDPYLRTLRNEPSNLPSVVTAIADALTTDAVALAVTLKENAMRVFGMQFLPINDAAAGTDAETTTIGTSHNTATATTGGTGKRDAKKKSKEDTQSDAAATARGNTADDRTAKTKGKPVQKPSSEGDDSNDDDDDDDDDEVEENAVNEEVDDEEAKEVGAIKALSSSLGTVTIAEVGQPYFSCQKCRTALFTQSSVLAHGLGAARTVFKVGDEGLCSAALFLSHNSAVASSSSSGQKKGKKNKKGDSEENVRDDDGVGYAVNGTNVECLHCSTKLGRYSIGEATCPCGAVVPGPAVRITTAKVDFVDGSLDAFQLAERSRLEAAERDLLGDDDEQDDDEQAGTGRKNKKKKKLCSENRGNFSNFRNKSFIPNASRVAKKNVDDDKIQREGQTHKGKRNDDDDNDEDNTDDDDQKEEDDEDVDDKRGKGKGKASSKIEAGNSKKGKAIVTSNSHFGALDSSSEEES